MAIVVDVSSVGYIIKFSLTHWETTLKMEAIFNTLKKTNFRNPALHNLTRFNSFKMPILAGASTLGLIVGKVFAAT